MNHDPKSDGRPANGLVVNERQEPHPLADLKLHITSTPPLIVRPGVIDASVIQSLQGKIVYVVVPGSAVPEIAAPAHMVAGVILGETAVVVVIPRQAGVGSRPD